MKDWKQVWPGAVRISGWSLLAGLACWLVLTTACTKSAAPSTVQKAVPEGTRRMANRLAEIARTTDPLKNEFLSGQRAEVFASMLKQETDINRKLDLQREYARSLLNSGQSRQAVEAFERLKSMLAEHRPEILEANELLLLTELAVAHLRIGEQANCLNHHSTDSCLVPIRQGGVHELQEGSRRAKQILIDILIQYPEDATARWLLNLAAMTLGEYPEGVPEKWRVDPDVFRSDSDPGRFADAAPRVGLDTVSLAGGSVMEDFNRDGYLDVMVSSMGLRDPLRLFVNNGDGSFSERTEAALLTGLTGGLNLVNADYNNDGFTDVFVLRGGWMSRAGKHPNSLLRNNGDGTFEDVTEAAGLLSFHPTQTAVWFDYNRDGWLDLFIGNESFKREPHPCELYRNNGDGTFTNVAARSNAGYAAFVKAVVSADYNRDGWPDLFLSVMGGDNLLLRNEGPQKNAAGESIGFRFRNVAARAGVTEPIDSFPSWFWDYNNDGWPDLFVAGYQWDSVEPLFAEYLKRPTDGATVRLYRNDGDGTFTDVSQEAGVDKVLYAMGVNFGDLDNDGFQDFYVGTGIPHLSALVPNRMFRNAAGRSFQDVTTSGGFGHIQKGHGVSFGDLDNDGDQDVLAVMGGFYSGDVYMNALFENPGHDHHWLKLKLEGVTSNRSAIGARVRVALATQDGERVIHRTVGTGGSFGSNPLLCEIGLGKATAVKEIQVHWPSGNEQSFDQVELDTQYRIREDRNQLERLPLKRIEFSEGS